MNFLYSKTLGRGRLPVFGIISKRKSKRITTVLTREQVQQILTNITNVPRRMCLTTMYACGLRLNEARTLRVDDIDSERMLLYVRCSKGQKDRAVPLPKKLLHKLRQYWRQVRPKDLMFITSTGKAIQRYSLSCTLRSVAKKLGFKGRISSHSLRHSYANHLLQQGVSLGNLQQILGHAKLESTIPYLRGYCLSLKELRPLVEKALAEI